MRGGEGNGGERQREEMEGWKLKQGRRLAKAGPANTFQDNYHVNNILRCTHG